MLKLTVSFELEKAKILADFEKTSIILAIKIYEKK